MATKQAARRTAVAMLTFLRRFRDHDFRREQQTGNRRRVLQREARDLGRIQDAGVDHAAVRARATLDSSLSRAFCARISATLPPGSGYAGHPMQPQPRINFLAHGILKRSDFGLSIGIPAPGTTMGVGDAVELESEFTGPLAFAKSRVI